MKKWLCLLLVSVMLVSLCACDAPTEASSPASNPVPDSTEKKTDLSTDYSVTAEGVVTNWLDTQTTLYKSGAYYEIHTDGMSYRYTVTAADGTVLDTGYHGYRGAFDITTHGDLLVLESGSGGNARSSYRYFDVRKGRVSPFFHNVLAVDGTRVAYLTEKADDGKTVLVVRDMFDPTHCYTEIQRDFAEGTALYYNTKATFKNNGAALEITYPYTAATPEAPEQYKTETVTLP